MHLRSGVYDLPESAGTGRPVLRQGNREMQMTGSRLP